MAPFARKLLIVLSLATAGGGLALAQPAPRIIPDEVPPGVGRGKAVEAANEPLPPAEPLKVEVVPEDKQAQARGPAAPSMTRSRFPIAIVQVVDKITTETNRFEIRIDRPVQYKTLIFTLHACEGSAPGEIDRDFVAHMSVDFQAPAPQGRPRPARKAVFRGWMYASSPSVSPFEHSTYDAWLIACKTDLPPPPPAPDAPKSAATPSAGASSPR